MSAVIDFNALTKELHEVQETLVDQEDREDISPYMFEVILPMLAQGEYPLLREIDFEQFEQRDPARLAGYIQDRDRRVYELTSINESLCHLKPTCVKSRAFL